MQDSYAGQQGVSSISSAFNAMAAIINSMLSTVRTAILVQIQAVTNAGGLTQIGTVNFVPLVDALDGFGQAWPHSIVYQCPYLRIAGGANAVILDPQVGDIGIAMVADRDISNVVSKQANVPSNPSQTTSHAPPASQRRFDFTDAIYLGMVLNGLPTQYIQFNTSGITVVSPTAVNVQAPQVNVHASQQVTIQAPQINSKGTWSHNGTITSTGDIKAGSISLENHVTTGVVPGGGTSGPPE